MLIYKQMRFQRSIYHSDKLMDLDKLRHQLAMSLSREIEFDVTDIFGPKNKGRFVNSLICKVFILRRKIHLFLIVSFSLVGKVV